MDIVQESEHLADSSTQTSQWNVLGRRLPKSEIVYFSQVLLVYIVVITCIVNLSLGKDEGKLWTALLSSCLGYLLPSPSIKHDTR